MEGGRTKSAVKSLAQILANTRVDPATGCRIWLGGTYSNSYGQVWWQGRGCHVHRVVWTLIHGDPGDLDVLHTCDNRPCCEPIHLFLGTQTDNNKDCVAKGRRPRGGRCYNHKLTEAQVVEIKELLAAGETHTRVALRFRVTSQAISSIARNVTWKHVR